MSNTTVLLIAACNNANYIGKDGSLMYEIKEDLARFKQITRKGTLIMGRKTYESLQIVLPDRNHIVVTSSPSLIKNHPKTNEKSGLVTFMDTTNGAFEMARNIESEKEDPRICFIGGESIYQACLPYINQAHLTIIQDDKLGDAKFPYKDFERLMANEFNLVKSSLNEYSGYRVNFSDYRKKDLSDETPINYVDSLGNRMLIISDSTRSIRLDRNAIILYMPTKSETGMVIHTSDGKTELRYKDRSRRDAALDSLDQLFAAS